MTIIWTGRREHIEQLFQRLNQQGTRLDGEELAYSMIKLTGRTWRGD